MEGFLLFQDKGGQFMDTTTPPAIEFSSDLARESLIAISQLSPDNNLSASKVLGDNPNSVNGFAVKESDRAEDYRSKLISISYTLSPDSNDSNLTRKSPWLAGKKLLWVVKVCCSLLLQFVILNWSEWMHQLMVTFVGDDSSLYWCSAK